MSVILSVSLGNVQDDQNLPSASDNDIDADLSSEKSFTNVSATDITLSVKKVAFTQSV